MKITNLDLLFRIAVKVLTFSAKQKKGERLLRDLRCLSKNKFYKKILFFSLSSFYLSFSECQNKNALIK